MTTTFNPGPSKVYPEIPAYVQDAYDQGILSINHRSEGFMTLCREAVELLKDRLSIPDSYRIVFTSSATECWEVIAQSLTRTMSYHFYNGSFGEKWFTFAKNIRPKAKATTFDLTKMPDFESIKLPKATEILCFTHNETSNGTRIPQMALESIHRKYPQALIAIDATSSLGGIALDFSRIDIAYGSVQKCLGLPAGLGLMILSPRAVERARQLNEGGHYNSLLRMLENMDKYQTHYTPNVLGIYLLKRSMEKRYGIGPIHKRLEEQYKDLSEVITNSSVLDWMVPDEYLRSRTVLAVKAPADRIAEIHRTANEAGIQLGKGYGPHKETSFRIANFPAIDSEDVEKLKAFLLNNYS
ncbi:aminotransferase class V-fold PLP-dependent enzyme [Roseivirga sp. BDSF3-8]|uniref:aminotransferase class V-fold PLP-dependent enzyme n=1 Tax=Roseivirga sp. BDSF3-8 TaxID=3241598 RepID=UPI00353227A6